MASGASVAKVWWHKPRALSRAEKVADALVHSLGLVIALFAGAALIGFALTGQAPAAFGALIVYIVSLIGLLSVSLAFNMWPRNGLKKFWARLDQATIFLFIAGTYTPFLSFVWETPLGLGVTVFVWGAALVGCALKLTVPHWFGRWAIALHLAIGWSGIVVFQTLADILPSSALWLLLGGGLTYSAGIIFHLWDRLKFNTAVWHLFVVAGATLHLFAIFRAMAIA